MRSSANKSRLQTGVIFGLMIMVSNFALPAFTFEAAHAKNITSVVARASEADKATRSRVRSSYGKLPLSFEKNHGQAVSQVKFIARGAGYGLFLTASGAVLTLGNEAESSALKMQVVGASAHSRVVGLDAMRGKSNYIIGSDRKKWRTGVPSFGKVLYEEIYPGVDMVYYGNQQQLEYDFIIAPGGDPESIRLGFEGAHMLRVDESGDLVLGTSAGEIRQRRPFIYQEASGMKKQVAGRYVIERDNKVSFEVADYDKSKPLIIDPVLVYSTYLGSSQTDEGSAIAVDGEGNAYVTGFTSAADFPVTLGAFQQALKGPFTDVFVTKLNPSGTALIYSTYLGGNGRVGERGRGIAVDAASSAYVTGETFSVDFPTTPGSFRPSIDPGDLFSFSAVFVTKLDPSGGKLIYSTFIGPGQGNGITIDQAGNAYVTGVAVSNIPPASNFPVTPGAFQTTPSPMDLNDAFVTKLNPLGSGLVYSTLLGGRRMDQSRAIAIDAAGNAFVTGVTESANFPVTPGAFQTTNRSGTVPGSDGDAFVTRLNAAGSGLIYSTYLGGVDYDEAFGIAVDAASNAYVTGITSSSNFPTTAGVVQPTPPGGVDEAFITRVNATGSGLVYSTFIGGNGMDFGRAIAVDAAGNATVTGATNSMSFPTVRALQSTVNSPFFKSTDRGDSWRVFNSGLTVNEVFALAIDPQNPTTLYLGNSAGLFKSTDGGQSWNDTSFGFPRGRNPVVDIVVDPLRSDTVYAVTFTQGIIKSTDGGRTWRDLGQTDALSSLAIDPRNPSTLYVTAIARNNSGVLKTTNGGNSWAFVDIAPRRRIINVIASDPKYP